MDEPKTLNAVKANRPPNRREPQDHRDNFPPEWWDERRSRDYYIDENDLVKLRAYSPTWYRLGEALCEASKKIVANLSAKNPDKAETYRERGESYREMTELQMGKEISKPQSTQE